MIRCPPKCKLDFASGGFRGALLDQFLQRVERMLVVEANVESRARFTRDQVDGLVADIDRGEFEMRARKLGAALIERLALQRRDQCCQSTNWIVGALRIGDVTLLARDDQVAVERTAPANFDGVAEFILIAWLAQDAVIKALAVLSRPFQKLGRAIDRDAFLVAGDQKRNRAFWLAAMMVQVVENSRDRASNATLHVDRPAAIQLAVRHLARKWRMLPGFFVARRRHVGIAGKYKLRLFCAYAGVEIFDVFGAGLAERHAMHGETCGFQNALEKRERAAFRRRDPRAAQQIAGNGDRIGSNSRCAPSPTTN